MKKLLRMVFWTLLSLGVGLVLALLVGYLVAQPQDSIPRTVAQDTSLPTLLGAGGVRLHGESFGPDDAPVVVVLHGGPGNDYKALLSLRALADRHRVVFYDQRGAGLSERLPDAQLTLAETYADLGAVLDRFAPRRQAVLIGHSWGAMLAVGYTSQHPERIAGLVLAEPGFLHDQAAVEFLQRTNHLMPKMSLRNLLLVGEAWLESLHVTGPDDDAARDYLAARIGTHPEVEGHPIAGYFCDRKFENAVLDDFRFGARAGQALLREGTDDHGTFRVDFLHGIERFEGPVLFLVGSCNTILGEDFQRAQHLDTFPQAELKVIAGAGHTMFGEKPAQSVAILRGFLARTTHE